ncbi:MAG: MotA/TolQ/ExbB proton channel family protein [Pirellulales bacterium]|nr:MotA/TolQ/ExbB proton channel family protein [Pirellulales bacterium]
MPTLEQFIQFLRARGGRRLVLEPDKPGWYLTENGMRHVLNSRFNKEQLTLFLEQNVPDQHKEALREGRPFAFSCSSAQGTAAVIISFLDGNLRIEIDPQNTATFVSAAGDGGRAAPSSTPPVLPGDAAPDPAPRVSPHFFPTFEIDQVPRILTRSDRQLKAVASIVGSGIGLLVSLAIMVLSGRESMIGRMFDWRNIGTLIPVSICCMFFWGCVTCWIRFRRLRALEPLCRKNLLLKITQDLPVFGMERVAQALDVPHGAASPLLRRVRAVLEQWRIRPGMAETDIVLQQHVAGDEEDVHAGYSLVRTFVWALPVLGLIGTVIGISLAVGGFALFLGAGVEDVALIKKNLVGVTGGLSFAFLITLQGLLTSLLLMLAASSLQTRERRLYADLQQSLVDVFLPALQRVAPVADNDAFGGKNKTVVERDESLANAVAAMLERVGDGAEKQMGAIGESLAQTAADLHKSLAQSAEAVLAEVGRTSQQLQDEMKSHTTAAEGELAQWSEMQKQQITAFSDRIGAALERANEHLGAVDREYEGRLQQLSQSLDRQAERLQEILDGQAQAFEQLHADLMAAIENQNKQIFANGEALLAVAETGRAVVEGQKVLQAGWRELQDAGLQKAFGDIAETMTAQCDEVRSLAQAVRQAGELTSQVIEAQAVLQKATKELHESDFTVTLAAFQRSLSSLATVLEGFRKPFVLQAVSLSGDGDDGHPAQRGDIGLLSR